MKKKLLLTLTILGAFVFAGCGKRKTTIKTTGKATTKVTTKTTTKATTTERKEMRTEYDRNFKYEYVIEYDSAEYGKCETITCSYKKAGSDSYTYYYKKFIDYGGKTRKSKADIIISYTYDAENDKWLENIKESVDGPETHYQYIRYTYNSSTKKWDFAYVKLILGDNIDGKTYENEVTEFDYKDCYVDGVLVKNPAQTMVRITYDSKMNVDYRIKYVYDDSLEDWVEESKTNYFYDEEEFITEVTSDYDDGEYKLAHKKENYYDSNSNLIRFKEYNYIDSGWELTKIEEFEYDESNISIHKISNYENGEYKSTEKYESLYDEYYNSIGIINYLKDNDNYIPQEKTTWLIDKFGNKVELIRYTWDNETSSWVED